MPVEVLERASLASLVAAPELPPQKEEPKVPERPTFKKLPGFHYSFKPTEARKKNLLQLADYLAKLPKDYKDFNMSQYTDSGLGPYAYTCGTVACAAGHGPAAGIKPHSRLDWGEYTVRHFLGPDSGFPGYSFDWLFGPGWEAEDNTPHGAANRIYYTLEHGTPERYRRSPKPING